jgi:hypothetical protein
MDFQRKDQITRFSELATEWQDSDVEKLPDLTLNKLIGNPKDCLIFHRVNGIEDIKSEDDILFVFATPDQTVMETFDRFATDKLLKKLGFDDKKIELLKTFIWNYATLVINKVTKDFEPYSGFNLTPFAMTLNHQGTFARKTYYL